MMRAVEYVTLYEREDAGAVGNVFLEDFAETCRKRNVRILRGYLNQMAEFQQKWNAFRSRVGEDKFAEHGLIRLIFLAHPDLAKDVKWWALNMPDYCGSANEKLIMRLTREIVEAEGREDGPGQG